MSKRHHLFSVYGIELEYMIVNQRDLSVNPIVDELFKEVAGEYTDAIHINNIAWNNELAAHVIEINNLTPVASIDNLDEVFHQHILHINRLLEKHHAKLLSTGAHPWMDPLSETKLWPHGDQIIYQTFDRIFNCQGHGWSNLQSTHLNLPFANDEEFMKLHSAIRLLLPIMPALMASSPVLEGKKSPYCDGRLAYYGGNQKNIPSIAGEIIPEFIANEAAYEQKILQPMYDDISPFDPEKILQAEWLNSRAAIARFDRSAIEIRALDIQEAPIADIACVYAIINVLKNITQGIDDYFSKPFSTAYLRQIFDEVIKEGFSAKLPKDYLEQLGLIIDHDCDANFVWSALIERNFAEIPEKYQCCLEHILAQGNLSERIQKRLGADFSRRNLHVVYEELSQCLRDNRMFGK